MRSRLLLIAALLLAPACTDHCLRNSDCAAGQGCVQGACVSLVDMATPDLTTPAPDLRVPDLSTPDLVVQDLKN